MKKFCVGIALLLSACGGGGSYSDQSGSSGGSTGGSAPSAAGRYDGTLSNNRSVSALVLSNNSYWMWYTRSGSSTTPGGFIQGSGSVTGTDNANGSLSSTDGLDFSVEGNGIRSLSLNGSYATQISLSATLSYSSGTSSLGSSYNAAYAATPSLQTLAGIFVGPGGSILSSANYISTATVTVTAAGAISSVDSNGCQSSGTISPHSSGNLYDVRIVYGGGGCALGSTTVSGVAMYDSGTQLLRYAAVDGNRSVGAMFSGGRTQ